jgi:hypothetical protein
MLSVNYLSSFLIDKQFNIDKSIYDKIHDFELNKDNYIKIPSSANINLNLDNKLDKYALCLPTPFDILFNKSSKYFYYDNKIYKNKSKTFTLIHSLLSIGNDLFNLQNENEKEKIIKELIKKIDFDLFDKNLYAKFNYIKNRKFNKVNIQSVLKDSFQFKNNDNFNLLKEYISDYFGINLYIFNIENTIIYYDKCEKYLSKIYGENFNIYLPTICLIYENEIYKPIMIKNNNIKSSILLHSNDEELIISIWNYFKIDKEYNEIKLNNDKIKESLLDSKNNLEIKEGEIKDCEEEENKIKEDKIKKEDSKEDIKIIIKNKNIFDLNILSSMKIGTLKELCNKNSIDTQKKSEKTNKMINKLKTELIDDLLKL